MNAGSVLVLERFIAQAEQIGELKRSLQLVAERLRDIPGIRQVELFQSQANEGEFVFFLSVDDLPRATAMMDQTDWHQQLVQELPRLITGAPERVVGSRIA